MAAKSAHNIFKIARITWLFLSLVILAVAILIRITDLPYSADDFLFISMFIICLPLSLLGLILLLPIVQSLMPFYPPSRFRETIVLWATLFLIGLFQWYLFPIISRILSATGTSYSKEIQNFNDPSCPQLEIPDDVGQRRWGLAVLISIAVSIILIFAAYQIKKRDDLRRPHSDFEPRFE
jgi:ABC-type branched-subunit amino acid transport system permease subunit